MWLSKESDVHVISDSDESPCLIRKKRQYELSTHLGSHISVSSPKLKLRGSQYADMTDQKALVMPLKKPLWLFYCLVPGSKKQHCNICYYIIFKSTQT